MISAPPLSSVGEAEGGATGTDAAGVRCAERDTDCTFVSDAVPIGEAAIGVVFALDVAVRRVDVAVSVVSVLGEAAPVRVASVFCDAVPARVASVVDEVAPEFEAAVGVVFALVEAEPGLDAPVGVEVAPDRGVTTEEVALPSETCCPMAAAQNVEQVTIDAARRRYFIGRSPSVIRRRNKRHHRVYRLRSDSSSHLSRRERPFRFKKATARFGSHAPACESNTTPVGAPSGNSRYHGVRGRSVFKKTTGNGSSVSACRDNRIR